VTRLAATRLTGPRLLASGAAWLPEAAAGTPVRHSDVHTAMFLAAKDLEQIATDQAHVLADEGEEVLLAYLIDMGEVSADPTIAAGRKVRDWVRSHGLEDVAAAMTRAAIVLAAELAEVA